MITLFATAGSGNCFKAQLLMRQLEIAHHTVMVDVIGGETRKPAFLRINPNGTVPFLLLEDGRGIAESNAILWYLAKGSHLFPQSTFEEAMAVQWMIFEQTKLESNISPARFFTTIVPERREGMEDRILAWQSAGRQGLTRLDAHLRFQDFIAGPRYSIADIAVYGYTHVAGEGGFDLDAYPAVSAWIDRIKASTGYVAMPDLAQAA